MDTRLVYLHGPLREKYGSEPFDFRANNINELLAGLTIFCPGFRNELRQYSTISIVKVRDGTPSSVPPEEYRFNFGECQELHVNVNVTVAGAVAFATAIAEYGTAAWYAAYAVYTIALSYVMGQVIQSMQDTITTEAGKPDNKSALFNGPENRVRQGGRVQLNYGRFRVGSVTLNQAMSGVRQVLTKTDAISILTGETGSLNMFTNDNFVISPVVGSFTIAGTTTAAGGTYTGSGFTATVTAAGLVTVVSTSTTEAAFDITISGTDTGTSPVQIIDQTVVATITVPQETYWSQGGTGDNVGGENGGGDAGDGGSGDAAGVGSAGA